MGTINQESQENKKSSNNKAGQEIQKNKDILSLEGQKILVTGVSRHKGIGAAIVKQLSAAGAKVAAHGYTDYDFQMQYKDAETALSPRFYENVTYLPSSDLMEAGEAEQVVDEAVKVCGGLSGLVLNHAYSTHCPFGEWTLEHIDRHLLVNVRASMLMIQRFAMQAQGGCITLFTSGQYLGPMTGEMAYAVSKEAIRGLCVQAAHLLAPQGIRVNCINPGPNDTGYLHGEDYHTVAKMFPRGRWGKPDDAADLVHFLHSAKAEWITGQTIASEGGFNRFGN